MRLKTLFIFFSGVLFATKRLPDFLMLQERKEVVSLEFRFGNFLQFILDNFEPGRFETLNECIKFPNAQNCPNQIISDIELFTNMSIEYWEKGIKSQTNPTVTSLQNLLKTHHHLYRVFSLGLEKCPFIDELVAKIYYKGIQETSSKSSKYLSIYYFIKRLPKLEQILAELSLPHFPFIQACDLFLNHVLELIFDYSVYSPVLKHPDFNRVLNVEFTQNFFGIFCPHKQFIFLLPFSEDEVAFSANLINFIKDGGKETLIPSKSKVISSLMPKDTCVFKNLALNADNIHIKRIRNCARRFTETVLKMDFRTELIPEFLERIHLLKVLPSSMIQAVLKYVTRKFDNSEQANEHFKLDQLTLGHKRSLNEFIGIVDDEGGFCSENILIVKDSLIRLGSNEFYDPFLKFSMLLLPFLENPEKPFKNDFLADLKKEKINYPRLSEVLEWEVILEPTCPSPFHNCITFYEFLEAQDPNQGAFCIFSKNLLDFSEFSFLSLVYFTSRLIDSFILPGSGSLLEFLLLNVRIPPVLHKFYINLLKAGKGLDYNFKYLFDLFPLEDQRMLILVLSPKRNFGEWCDHLLKVMEVKIREKAFMRSLIRKSSI
jgi:hypothetical protein